MAHLRTRRLVASFVAATVMAASATIAQAQVPPPSCPPPATVVPVGASERLQFLGPDSNDRSDRTSEASPREIPEFATLTIVNAGGSSLVIRIDAGGPQARRMQVGGAAAGAPQSCATVPQNGTWQITAADLRRIAAPEDLVIIRATDAAGAPAAPAGYIGLASDLTADETAAQTLQRRQTDVAQAAIVDKAAAAKPPAQAAAPAAPATPALPIEIGTGPPAGTTDPQRPFAVTEHAIALTNSNAVARRVALLDDAGATARSIDVAGQTSAAPILLDEASRLAGDDRILPFRVTDPAGTDLGTGFLSLPQRVLSGRVVVPLEVTGIGDWRFLNPRAAHTITTTTTLVFVPRVPGRTITLSFPSIDRALEPEFTQAGFVVKCDRPKTCVPVLEVQTTQREVAGRLLIRAYASGEGLVEFRMAFFEEDIEPANASGFVRVSPTQFEPPFSTTWNATAFAAVVRDAYFEGFRQDPAKAPSSPRTCRSMISLAGISPAT